MDALVRCLQELPIELIRPGGALHNPFLACLVGDGGSVDALIEGLTIKTEAFFESQAGSHDLQQLYSDFQVAGGCIQQEQ